MGKTDNLIRHGSFFVIIAMLGNAFNVLFNIVMIRMLGPYDYGIFETLLSVLAILAVPSGVILMTIARYAAQYSAHNHDDNIRHLLRKATLITLLVGLIGGLAVFGIKKIILSQLNIQLKSVLPMLIISFILALGLVLPVFRGSLQGLQKFRWLGLNTIADSIVRLTAGIGLVYLGLGIAGALGASLAVTLIAFVLSIIPLRYYLKKPKQIVAESSSTHFYIYAIPVLFYLLGREAFARLDIFIISRYLTDFRGYYTAAALIGVAIWVLPIAIITVMFPKVAHTHAKQESSLHLVQKSLLFSGLLCLIGIAICWIFPRLVIAILYGSKYPIETMTSYIRWFSIAVTPIALANVLLNYHLAKADYACIYLLISGVVLHSILLILFHQTVYHVLSIIFLSGILQIIANYWLLIYKGKQQLNEIKELSS